MPDLQYEGIMPITEKDLKNVGCTKEEIEAANAMSSEEREKYFIGRIDKMHPSYWEYTTDDNLQIIYKMTNNPDMLTKAIRVWGDQLTTQDKAYILKHRQLGLKMKEDKEARQKDLLEKTQKGEAPQVYETGVQVQDDGETVYLPDIKLNSHQTQPQGCWSVSMSLQLQARGVQMSQEEIRTYRPDINNDKEAFELSTKYNNQAREGYLKNGANNFMEMGDAALQMAPDSMIHEIEIPPYDVTMKRAGISKEAFVQNVVTEARKTILHAIKEDKSPVSFLYGGHYITIVGLDKNNNVMYKESKPRYKEGKLLDSDTTFHAPLDKLLTPLALGKRGIQLSWMSEINLSKDGKTIYGIPSQYVQMKEDGSLTNQPDDLRTISGGDSVAHNVAGVRVYREGETEDPEYTNQHRIVNGIRKIEKVYIPENLDVTSLKAKANARSDEKEKQLADQSQAFYGFDPGEHLSPEDYKQKEKEIESRRRAEKEARDKAAAERMKQKIDEASHNANAHPAAPSKREKAFDDYIKGVLEKAVNAKPYQKKMALASVLIADQYKAAGESFNQAKMINNTNVNAAFVQYGLESWDE